MIIIPPRETKQLVQKNRGKLLGNIWASFCLDLQSELGAIRVSPRLKINTTSTSTIPSTDLGIPTAFMSFDQIIFALCGARVLKNTSFDLISSFVTDVSTGADSSYDASYCDMTLFNQTLVTTTPTKVLSKAVNGSGTGAWTQRATLGTATSLHKLCWMPGTNRVYYFDDFQSIKSLDTTWTEATSGTYFISIPYTSGLLYTMLADKTNIWIGTVNTAPSGVLNLMGGGSILLWDGISSTPTAEYKIKAKGVLALAKDDRGIVFAIDTSGNLLEFNGDGFEEVDRLPVGNSYLTNALGGSSSTAGKYDSFIHPNGFVFSKNGSLLVLVNNLVGDNGGTIKENLPSGVWEWKKETGFIHRNAFSLNTVGSTTITDYGQNRISRVGALYEPNIYTTSASGKSTLLCGATYYTDSSTTANGIFVDDPLNTTQKYGYFVTSWVTSTALKDVWQKLALKYKKLLSSTDKIWIKYRLTDVDPTEFTLTWTAATPTTATFTTTTDLTGKEGYEVEVLQGTGSGKCAHITSITNNAGTYTVVLDEQFTGITTGTAKARYQAWKKHIVVSDQTSESIMRAISRATSERAQFKICMQFTGDDEVYEFIVVNKNHDSLE